MHCAVSRQQMATRFRASRKVWLPTAQRYPGIFRHGQLGSPLALQQTQSKCIAAAVNSIPGGKTALESSATVLRPFTDIPLARGAVPFLGHYPIMRMNRGVQHLELIRRWFRELGPIFRVKFPFQDMVFVYKPSAAEEVFRSEGPYPERVPTIESSVQQVYNELNLPTPFTFMNGKEWKDNRILHQKQVQPRNVHCYTAGMARATDRFMRALESGRNKEEYVENIHPLVLNWTMEASAWFAIGVDLDISKETDQDAVEFQKSVRDLFNGMEYFSRIALPFYKIYPTKEYKKAKQAFLSMRQLGRKYLERNRETIEKRVREGGNTEGLSLIEQWMIEGKMNEEQCIASAMDMFGAGIDTTANFTTFLMYELAKNPEVQEKLRQQVLSVLGEDGEVDAVSLQKMPYLKDIIKETHRVNTVIETIPRTVQTDIELMGYRIPAKTAVGVSINMQSHDASLYTDPEKYNPDRWSSETDKPHPFCNLMFGVGSKACYGRRLAELELKILLTKLCRRFIMSAEGPPDARLPYNWRLLLRPEGPVRIKFTPR